MLSGVPIGKSALGSIALVLVGACVIGACGDDEKAEEPTPDAGAPEAAAPIDSAPPPVDASDAPPPLDLSAILARLANCDEITPTNDRYATDEGEAKEIPVCQLKNAIFWQADMDIDCDGKESAVCNKTADPAYQDQTSGTDSNGDPLDAAQLPFVVVPLKSSRFDYKQHGIDIGTVFLVAYKGKFEFGIFGDQGPTSIIGEASYAMAEKLGINSNPASGGTDSGVTYIAFTGDTGMVKKLEDREETVRIGELRARQLLTDNPQ